MKNKMVIIAAAIIVCTVQGPARCHSESGKASWLNCLDREDCLKLSEGFMLKLKKKYDRETALNASLSALLAEYLRPDGSPIDLSRTAPDLSQKLVDALFSLVMGNRNRARDTISAMTDEEKETIPARFLLALSSEGDWPEFLRRSLEILSERSIPLLEYKIAARRLSQGRCRAAKTCLDRLMKRYAQNPAVVAGWAMANMDCGEYPGKIYGRLKRLLKRYPDDNGILAQQIRFLNYKKDDKKIEVMMSAIDPDSLSGINGSTLLTELARYRMDKGDITSARICLEKAVVLDPRNPSAHRLLGKVYLMDPRDISKAVALLKTYIRMAPETADAERISALIKDLASHSP